MIIKSLSKPVSFFTALWKLFSAIRRSFWKYSIVLFLILFCASPELVADIPFVGTAFNTIHIALCWVGDLTIVRLILDKLSFLFPLISGLFECAVILVPFFWVVSVLIVPVLTFLRKKLELLEEKLMERRAIKAAGLDRKKEPVQKPPKKKKVRRLKTAKKAVPVWGYAKLLSLRQRRRAKENLRELKEISEFCFNKKDETYIRIQWIAAHDGMEPDDVLYTFKELKKKKGIIITAGGTSKRLCFAKDAVGAYAYVPSTSEELVNRFAEQQIPLEMNVPVGIFGGSKAEGERILLFVITWIGDDRLC
ncbi:MAG: hypothetical protein IKJ74_05855 [Clostridia bacterium]|nr:hypothetical protein [Clostridia bacterium]